MTKPTHTIGWDVGGAHLKAAVVNGQGETVALHLLACPLWQGLPTLTAAIASVMATLPYGAYQHALTMTGELVDLFSSRDQGVASILATLTQVLPASSLQIFVGSQGLIPFPQINASHYPAIASSNWLASAQLAATRVGNGLFIDIGSTTTDLAVLRGQQVCVQGYSDYQRLISKELVYTGIVRTPVMAVAQSIRDNGHTVGLMAEYFATMADVYRITGELDEHHDHTPTADGAEKTPSASARRLARMIGCDFTADEWPRWQQLAQQLRQRQLDTLRAAAEGLQTGLQAPTGLTVVGAGIGRFLARQLASAWQCPYTDFSEFCPQNPVGPLTPADCAPAVAVAYLRHSAG